MTKKVTAWEIAMGITFAVIAVVGVFCCLCLLLFNFVVVCVYIGIVVFVIFVLGMFCWSLLLLVVVCVWC